MSATVRSGLPSGQTEPAVRALLASVAQLRGAADTLSADSDLYAAGLSSLATIDLMMALEEQFDIEFPDRLLNRRTFASIAAIAAAVDDIRGAA